ncbi:hypothetical protein Btru_038615 [Bulinus truncatus]|nr:hypothetical protein Btru_038615 [Bulinus truncatus]
MLIVKIVINRICHDITIFYFLLLTNNLKLFGAELLLDEPDYKNILYGGVWKHVVFEPSQKSDDVKMANEVSFKFVFSRTIHSDLKNFTVSCITKADLWYSESGYTPLVFTELVESYKGHEVPVSVPLSYGTTYNIEVQVFTNESVNFHFITLTKSKEHERFFVYSHSFRGFDDVEVEMRNRYKSLAHVDKDKIGLNILSCLCRNKQLLLYPAIDQVAIVSDAEFKCKIAAAKNVRENCIQKYTIKSELSNKSECAAFKVMTFNIWNFNTYYGDSLDYPARLEAIGKLLKRANPDIVAFQEVRFESPLGKHFGPSQIDYLISQLSEYQFIYQPAQLQSSSFDHGRTEEGVAIFSKFPIVHHDYLLLFRNRSNSADLHQRICLHAVVDLPCVGKGHIFNTHLSLSHEAREESVKQIIQYMSLHGAEPAILVGDLNATPEEKAVRLLAEDAGFVDVWTLLQPSKDGFTYNAIDQLTKRIDYIFMKKSEAIVAENIEVLPDNSRSSAASDHRALQATFRANYNNC